jgi:glycerol uptake facilitator-like aquaporin
VSLAAFVAGRFTLIDTIMYMVAQTFGATFGALTVAVRKYFLNYVI